MATIPQLVCAATFLHPKLYFWHATVGSLGMSVLFPFQLTLTTSQGKGLEQGATF